MFRAPLDVTDESGVNETVRAALERFGHIDALVNNAGISFLGAVEESSGADGLRLLGRRPDLGRVESPFGRAPLCVQGGGLSSSAASLVLRPSLPRDLDTDSDDPLLELVRRWHAGDRGALEQLLTEVEPWLRREVHRAMSGKAVNEQESSDLSQQARLNFLESGPRILPRSGAQFRALLRRIALNELIDQSRRGRLRDGLRADT